MHNYAEWQKLDTKDYILHDSIYIKIQKMPSNLQKRQWLLPGDHIAGKNYKEHTQGNFQEQLMFTILIGMMVSRTDTHVKPIKLYTSYMSNLFNVSYISVKLFFKKSISARFGSTYTKIGTIQRRLAWPLRKDDTQIREAFHIFAI